MLSGISSMAMRQVLAELEVTYDERVALAAAGGVEVERRIEAGEAFDFVVLAADAIDRLAAAGRVDAGTRIALARSRVAIAVVTGALRPRIDSADAVRAALAGARAVGYSTGPSGRHLLRLVEQWGIAPRLVQAPPGVPVGTLIARGEVDIGVQQMSELVGVPGVDVVGALPRDIEEITVFAGAVCASASRRDAAKAWLAYCASPATAGIKQRHGLDG